VSREERAYGEDAYALAPATEAMLAMTGVDAGARVLDLARVMGSQRR
jgi:hypothetical protein